MAHDINSTTVLVVVLLFTGAAGSVGLCAQTTTPAFLSEQPPRVITNEYIASHFYDRPSAVEFDRAAYGLTGRKLYVSALKGRDNNSGTKAAPFLTIQKAVDVCGPGDTIYVMEGTYYSNEYANVACFMEKHGTARHWIMLRNYPGQNPLISYKGWDAVSVQGSSYIIISGFIIRGQADKISYEYAYKNRKNTFNPPTMGAGVAVMYVWNDYAKRPHHVIVANNIVYNCPGAGIYAVMADYVSFLHNICCYNTKWSPFGTSGISMYQNQAVDDSSDIKMIIAGNVCYANENRIPFAQVNAISDGNGIIIDDLKHTQRWFPFNTPDRYTGKTLVENNICFYNGGRGIHVYQSEFVIVRNNTCYHNALSGEIKGGELNLDNSGSLVVEDNIAVSADKGGDKALLCSGCNNVEPADNLYSGRVDSPGPGRHALKNKDPKFINAVEEPAEADFRLSKDSPAVDYGASGASTDIEGVPRPQGSAYDLGAYEYVP